MQKLKMKKNTDLSIIILNFNAKKFLKNCLRSIFASKIEKCSFEVIVVDNASKDGSAEMLKKDFPEVRLLQNQNNLGFSAGNNRAIPKALGKHILFLNPDTIVFPDTIQKTLKFIQGKPKAGAVTCRVEMPNGKIDEGCHRGFPTPWNAFTHFFGLEKLFPTSPLFSGYRLGSKSLQTIHEIDSGTGAFLLVRKEAGTQVGWWDEDYFWYGEDIDLCFRLKKAGWKILFYPKAKIIHYKGVSSGIKRETQNISTATNKVRLCAAKASIQVMRIFYQKHYLNKYPRLVTFLVMKAIDLLEKIRVSKAS